MVKEMNSAKNSTPSINGARPISWQCLKQNDASGITNTYCSASWLNELLTTLKTGLSM